MLEKSENFAISDLVGLELQQVCIGQFQTSLRFESDASIAWNLESRKVDGFPKIIDLLGKKIHKIDIDLNNNLSLAFEGNISVEFPKDESGYESFEIWMGSECLIG